MVVVRFGRVDQARQAIVKQEECEQVEYNHNNMFKVPSSSSPTHQVNSQHHHQQQHQQQQHAEMLAAAKRKWQEANNTTATVGLAPAERPQQKQKTSTPPLTIFYAGAVNVYENVPESMVRALMTLAAAKSTKPGSVAMLNHLQKANLVNTKSCNNNNNNSFNSVAHLAGSFGFPTAVSQPSTGFGLPVVQPQQAQNISNATGTGFSFPASSTSTTREDTSLSLNFNNASEEKTPPPTATVQPSASTCSAPPSGDPLKTNNPRTKMQLLPAGLPQARRASIQRFLEKRKQK